MNMPIPFNEDSRLATLQRIHPQKFRDNPTLKWLVRMVARLLGTSSAAITLVEWDQQSFLATHGTQLCSSAREDAFCGHTIMSDSVLVIPDAASDPRFANTRLVAADPSVRFYAGAPLITREGFRIGALCALGSHPRVEGVSEDEAASLKDLAATVIDILEWEARDVEQRATEDSGADIQSLRSAAHEAALAKSEFLHTISHELRTPLNAILGFGTLLEAAKDAGDLKPLHGSYVQHMCTSAKHLHGLIEQVLTFSNLERGELYLEEQSCVPTEICHAARTVAEGVGCEKGASIVSAIETGAPGLRGDREQMIAMLVNLVTNALDHAEAGQITLLDRRTKGGGYALGVRDDGKGMPNVQKESPLCAFRQGENGLARTQGGLGLGLPLTERLIALHGGRLELDTQEGQGTTVWLVFPAWRVEDVT